MSTELYKNRINDEEVRVIKGLNKITVKRDGKTNLTFTNLDSFERKYEPLNFSYLGKKNYQKTKIPLAAGGGGGRSKTGGRVRNRLNECLFIISRIDGSQNKYCVNYDLFGNHLIPEEIDSNNWKKYDSEEIREDNKGKIWIIQDAFTRNGTKMYQIQPYRGEIGKNLKSIPITEWASYRKIL